MNTAIRLTVKGATSWSKDVIQVPAVGDKILCHGDEYTVTGVRWDLDGTGDGKQDATITVE